jgi:hypothetical protein
MPNDGLFLRWLLSNVMPWPSCIWADFGPHLLCNMFIIFILALSTADLPGGFLAQLAGSESRSNSSMLWGVSGPASWVGIPFELVDFGGGFWPS